MKFKLFATSLLFLFLLAYIFHQKIIDKNNLSKIELIKKKVHVDYHMYMLTRMMKNTYKYSSYIPDSLSFNDYIKIKYGEQSIKYLIKPCSNSTYCFKNDANLK